MDLYFITGNREKFQETQAILGIRLRRISLKLDEIQEVEISKVIKRKTKDAFAKIKKPLIVEDSGIYIKSWSGFPGALTKWLGKTLGYGKIPQLLKGDRAAAAETIVGYYDGKKYRQFRGRIYGKIAKKPAGKTGFGWDMIFIPAGSEKTFAQMDFSRKNEISMRKTALEKLKKFLKDKK